MCVRSKCVYLEASRVRRRPIPMLIEALTHTNWIVRKEGARGLGNLGFPSKEAISALRNALHDEDEGVRKFVSEVLIKIDPKATEKAGAK